MSTVLRTREVHAPDEKAAEVRDRAAFDRPDPEEPDADQANQYVTFAVAGEMFAVPIAPVQEIIRIPAVASLPLAPHALDGLTNLRGRVLPIVNLRRLLGCAERANDDATRALVIHIGQPLGFVVDRVASVVTIAPGEIESADAIQTIVAVDYLKGVIRRPRADGGHDILLSIDFERLVAVQLKSTLAGQRTERNGAGRPTANDAALGVEDPGVDELRLVSFTVADQEYALDIAEVQEIVQLPASVNELPHSPGHVLGVISLRQRLLPLVSLRTLFGLPPQAYSEKQRIVVTSLPGGLDVGLVTDSVKEVLSVPRSQADAMPGMLAGEEQLQEISWICRLEDGKRLVSIIDVARLLRLPDIGAALDAARHAHIDNTAQESRHMDMNQNGGTNETGDASDDDIQVVIFRLGAEEFGVPIMSVQEIVRVPETLTRVPRTPSFVEGVINLRGTVLPVIDQRARLGLPIIEHNDGQRIMVYLLGGKRTGFIVDSVAEVLRIPRARIVPAPLMSEEQGRLISRVANLEGDKRLVMLIDPAHLLRGAEIQEVGQIGAAPADASARRGAVTAD